ncbi:Ankyrin repeat [Thiothrix caldifontis]|uniref:Ankyrin repeat n=1 Tax=Thiothrix caldifontis TaxID=525918 RepID=A0A1H3WK10_9GAMM|nr:ankyrin repeat domain-containing protein [Thiothrix caldifontis]SDZ86672.1 Ankyrin repeat [Thiothrix caldifontis]
MKHHLQTTLSIRLIAIALLLGLNGCATTSETGSPPSTGIIAAATPSTEATPVATSETIATNDTAAASTAEPVVIEAGELNKQLWDAAQAGNATSVGSLLQQGADPSTATASGETALHAAVAAGSLPAVTQLVSKGAEINATTATGWTPLHHAARFGRADIANYLLQQGADPKALTTGTPAKTPVQMALDQGDLRTARILGY